MNLITISEKQYGNFVLLMLAFHSHFESIFITLKICLFKVHNLLNIFAQKYKIVQYGARNAKESI